MIMLNIADNDFYGEYAQALIEAEEVIRREVNRLIDSVSDDPEFSPAEHIRSRIKSPESICEKLERRGLSADMDTAAKNIYDIIGMRVVTHFVGDVYTVLELLKASGVWEITEIKDYISNPKPNGYRSLHVILRLPFDAVPSGAVYAEIQLRTVAMDTWASLEHQLKYKKSIDNTALIVGELKRCADELASTDLSMQTIREMIKMH